MPGGAEDVRSDLKNHGHEFRRGHPHRSVRRCDQRRPDRRSSAAPAAIRAGAPNARSSHSVPTPQGAGVAVIIATIGVAALAMLGLRQPASGHAAHRVCRDGTRRRGGRCRRHPNPGGCSAACAAGHCSQPGDRCAACGNADRAATAVVGRTGHAVRRLSLVHEPRQFHGRHGLDDRRRNHPSHWRDWQSSACPARCHHTRRSWRSRSAEPCSALRRSTSPPRACSWAMSGACRLAC